MSNRIEKASAKLSAKTRMIMNIIFIVVVLAVVVGANILTSFIVKRNPASQVDFTSDGAYSLQAGTVEYLNYLEDEIVIKVLCSEDKLISYDSSFGYGRVFKNSKMLSSDVTAAYDPLYADVSNKRCETFFNRGVSFCKYTGARGKSGSNDASCEYIAELRKIMDENDVKFQITEMGKVDAGGGGTIAYILANKNVSVIDCGVGVLSMHAPWEVTSKSDIYEAYRCYKAFLKDA